MCLLKLSPLMNGIFFKGHIVFSGSHYWKIHTFSTCNVLEWDSTTKLKCVSIYHYRQQAFIILLLFMDLSLLSYVLVTINKPTKTWKKNQCEHAFSESPRQNVCVHLIVDNNLHSFFIKGGKICYHMSLPTTKTSIFFQCAHGFTRSLCHMSLQNETTFINNMALAGLCTQRVN